MNAKRPPSDAWEDQAVTRPSLEEDGPASMAEPTVDLPRPGSVGDLGGWGDDEPRTQTSKIDREALARALEDEAGPFQLVVMGGVNMGDTIPLGVQTLTVGRDPHNALVLRSRGVSRTHAVVVPEGTGHVLKDQGSANGTFVNKRRVASRRLVDGDVIYLGSATLKYLSALNPEFAYHQHLRQASVRDPLTQAPNRRYFDDFLEREIERARRYSRPLSLLMVDVDHFKAVNDTHGHRAGDRVLREVVQLISARLRRSEFIARYGGEEFALLAPETPLEGAMTLAHGVRARVEAHGFAFEGAHIPLTVSVGVAGWAPQMNAGEDLVQLADERLYEAKRTGRNRVVGPPV